MTMLQGVVAITVFIAAVMGIVYFWSRIWKDKISGTVTDKASHRHQLEGNPLPGPGPIPMGRRIAFKVSTRDGDYFLDIEGSQLEINLLDKVVSLGASVAFLATRELQRERMGRVSTQHFIPVS